MLRGSEDAPVCTSNCLLWGTLTHPGCGSPFSHLLPARLPAALPAIPMACGQARIEALMYPCPAQVLLQQHPLEDMHFFPGLTEVPHSEGEGA